MHNLQQRSANRPSIKKNKNAGGSGGIPVPYIKQQKIRRLTPLETWRLQGFKDEDFYKVKDMSDTQLYKQAGNSITVDVLMHLFKKIYE